MNYYDLTDEQQAEMNVDDDFCACLEYNPQPFNLMDVEKVLAVIEGENNGPDWHWVVKLRDDRFLYLRGGCDYTGWNCQSDADTIFLGPEMPLLKAIKRLSPDWRSENPQDFLRKLQRQLKSRKDITWREKKDKEFGL